MTNTWFSTKGVDKSLRQAWVTVTVLSPFANFAPPSYRWLTEYWKMPSVNTFAFCAIAARAENDSVMNTVHNLCIELEVS